MSRAWLWTVMGFALLYCVALALYLVGTFGILGIERDPLAGVFLIPLGLPWNHLLDVLPEASWPWLAALAPAINLILLGIIGRRRQRGRRESTRACEKPTGG